jgi:hypothetical protein
MDEARQKYLQALAVDSSPSILLNLALLERDTKRPVEALKYARAYVAHPRVKADKAARIREQVIPELLAQTARVEVVATPGERVTLDGQDVGRAPLEATLDVMPGNHVIASAGTTREVKVGAGEVQRVEVKPTPRTLVVVPPPSASTAAPPPPPATAAPPQEGASSPPLPPPSEETWRWAVPAGVGGVGLIGLGLGTFFFVKAGDANGDAKSAASRVTGPCGGAPPGPCADEKSALDSRRSNAGLGTGFVAGGAVLVGAGVVTYFVLRPSSKEHAAWVMPVVGEKSGGVMAVGSF